jgi:predicted GH43/DUF377 family glycosyl hydrolase
MSSGPSESPSIRVHLRSSAAIATALLLVGCTESTASFTLPNPAPAHHITYARPQPNPTPVLKPGANAEFDSIDLLNPSITKTREIYSNFYSGFDGKSWHTGLATSLDGLTWTKRGRVLSPDPQGDTYIAANGSALIAETGEILYWYQAGRNRPQIGLARNWRKDPQPVLRPGPYRSWDERGVADPFVIRQGSYFYLYYTGLDRAQVQRLGVARSTDGTHWRKLVTNPILSPGGRDSMDEAGLGEPAVWQAGGKYWMLFTGRAWDEQRRLGLAESPDGVTWARVKNWSFSGTDSWDSKVVCDPSVEVTPTGVRLWFGGGDVASPDERLHGQIGYAFIPATPVP